MGYPHRSADCSAVIVGMARRLFGIAGLDGACGTSGIISETEEVRGRIPPLLPVLVVGRPVKLIGARLGLHVHHGARRVPVGRIERRRLQTELFNRVGRRHESYPAVAAGNGRAIDHVFVLADAAGGVEFRRAADIEGRRFSGTPVHCMPGARATRVNGLRSLNGNSIICRRSSNRPPEADTVSRIGASAVTSTFSLICPKGSSISRSARPATLTVMPLRTTRLKPDASTVIE